ncbi:MAG: hypothetical protein C4334_00925 [Pyrinomonas sp.]|uniref:TonB-dependent receptor n=1 Tax=Pyrinomonas sp. TaxID=2080306 RepID=UPI00332B8C2F
MLPVIASIRNLTVSCLTLLLFCSLPGALRAQQSGARISGTVTDQTGAVVVGATVRALNLASGREVSTATDGSGGYALGDLAPGSYRISVSQEGFAVAAASVVVTDSTPVVQNFALAPGALQDVVTVTAGKGSARIAVETPQTVSVTTEADLEQRRPVSTFQAIERTPNLIVRETNPARERPRLRGLDSSRVLIVIDGERLNNARTDLQTGLSPGIIDVSQLASAEVVAGAGSSLYGSDALAGTINLVTKGPDRPDKGLVLGLRLDGDYHSNGRTRRGNVAVNLSNPQAALRMSLSLFRNANYRTGGKAITLDDVLNIGRFYVQFPGNNASQYPVFSLPANGEVLNGQAHGFNDQLDFWFYPSANNRHNLRLRYLNSQHSALGDAFSGPPFEVQERFQSFRHFDKFGARYEGLDIGPRVARLAINFYRQKLVFPQDQFDYTIQSGSSFVVDPATNTFSFTGRPSNFILGSFTDNKNSITTLNVDVQATLVPFVGTLVTTGFQRLRDQSRDEFTRYGFRNIVTREPNFNTLTRGASSPDTDYTDTAFFAQFEYDRIRLLRLSGGFRLDNWKTEAKVTRGFPLGAEFVILRASIPVLSANPGPLAPQVDSLSRLLDLAGGRSPVRTSKTSFTGNVGIVFRFPQGINPYFRFATAYREPSVTERYIIRNFIPLPNILSAIVVGNPNLEPETARNFDVGVKVQRNRFNGSFGYFRNDLDNLIIFALPPGSPTPLGAGFLLVPADPANGLLGAPFNRGLHAVSFNGRINQAKNLIYGFEGTYEVALPLGEVGSLTPYGSMGWMHGTNKSPTATQLDIIRRLYNRSDTPVRLEGSPDDVPLGNITPFRGIFGAIFNERKGRWFIEYSLRHQARVTRANPTGFQGPTLINYGTFASLNDFTVQSVRGGYNLRRERYRMTFTTGVDNLTDLLYFEHFQNAPAPGRSFVFGFTMEFANLLGR